MPDGEFVSLNDVPLREVSKKVKLEKNDLKIE